MLLVAGGVAWLLAAETLASVLWFGGTVLSLLVERAPRTARRRGGGVVVEPSGHAIASEVTAIGIVMALINRPAAAARDDRRRARWQDHIATTATAPATSPRFPTPPGISPDEESLYDTPLDRGNHTRRKGRRLVHRHAAVCA